MTTRGRQPVIQRRRQQRSLIPGETRNALSTRRLRPAKCASARCPRSTPNNPPSASSSAHPSCPAPDPQPITPPGVSPTQAPPACRCPRSSKPTAEGPPTARPKTEKRERCGALTSIPRSATPPARLGLEHHARTTPSTSSRGRALRSYRSDQQPVGFSNARRPGQHPHHPYGQNGHHRHHLLSGAGIPGGNCDPSGYQHG
jgi:hypothetical protein